MPSHSLMPRWNIFFIVTHFAQNRNTRSAVDFSSNLWYDARVKSLKPRCACTGVVLWLSDPPDMSIKVERQLHDMRILGRVLCASGTRLAPTEVATEMWEYEVRNNP